MDSGAPLGAVAMVKRGDPPLLALMTVAVDAIERRHLELMAESGFDDVRRAHNSVLANLPAAGMRLTELAHSAGITKQAMAELVEDLQEKGYVEKVPDLSLIHISEPTRHICLSRMPSSA